MYFFCSSFFFLILFLDVILKFPKMIAVSFSQIAPILLCTYMERSARCLSPTTRRLFSLLLLGMLSGAVNFSLRGKADGTMSKVSNCGYDRPNSQN